MEGHQQFSAAEGASVQKSCLGRHVLRRPVSSWDIDEELEAGSMYEIVHKDLPPKSPKELKAVRVVMIAEKTEQNVAIIFPSSSALGRYFNFEKEMVTTNEPTREYPDLDVQFVMDLKVANEVLIRRILPPEMEEKGHSQSFWLVSQNVIEISTSTVKPLNEGVHRLTKNNNGLLTWGVRRRRTLLKKREENTRTSRTSKIIKRQKLSDDRWPRERYKNAEVKIAEILREKGAVFRKPMPLHQLRLEARKHIGEAHLLEHLLKHVAGKVTPNRTDRFCRHCNADGTLEYWLESADLVDDVNSLNWNPGNGEEENYPSKCHNTIGMSVSLPSLGLQMFAEDSRNSSTDVDFDLEELIRLENNMTRQNDGRKRKRNASDRPKRKYPSQQGNVKILCDFSRKFKVVDHFYIIPTGPVCYSSQLFGRISARYSNYYGKTKRVPSLKYFVQMVKKENEVVIDGAKDRDLVRNKYLIGSVVIENGKFRDEGCHIINSYDATQKEVRFNVHTPLPHQFTAIGSGSKTAKPWCNPTKWEKVKTVEEAKSMFVDALAEVVHKNSSCGGCLEIVVLTIDDEGKLVEDRLLNIQETLCDRFHCKARSSAFRSPWDEDQLVAYRTEIDDEGNYTVLQGEKLKEPLFTFKSG